MAISSKCPKCENSNFELSSESPKGSNYKINFIRCSSCGTVVGVLEYHSTAILLQKLARKLGASLNL